MEPELGPLTSPRRHGGEPFHRDGEPLGFDLQDFWAWSVSDLVSNATRGRLAEYLVARALGVPTSGVRNEWAAHDLTAPTGLKIEVKSAAYLQAWHQRHLSSIVFSIRPARAWDPTTNEQSPHQTREADVYVFALLAHRDKPTLDPMNTAQWRFYAVATRVLNARQRSQHSITLRSLEALAPAVPFASLATAVGGVRPG